MKTVRYRFNRGVTTLAAQQPVADGYSTIAENVDLRAGFRPLPLPEFVKSATGQRVYEFMGQWFFSAAWRDYAAERVGIHTHIYFTEQGSLQGPRKVVDGMEAALGTPVPSSGPKVTVDGYLYPLVTVQYTKADAGVLGCIQSTKDGKTVWIGPMKEGTWSYRVAATDDNDQPICASPRIEVTVPVGETGIVRIGIQPVKFTAKSYVIYGRTVGNECELVRLKANASALDWEDDGSTIGYTSPPSEDNADIQYFCTFIRSINLHEDESGPSPISAKVPMGRLRTLTLPQPPKDLQGFEGGCIYRVGDVSDWLRVKRIQAADWGQTFMDTVTTASLEGEADSYYDENGQTVIYAAPPSNLHGIVLHEEMLAGISGSQVRWTPKNRPDAWPVTFCAVVPNPLALASYGGSLFILCGEGLWRLDGHEPTAMTLSYTMVADGCIAPRAVVVTTHGIIYPSRRGVMLFDGIKATCITEGRLPGSFFMTSSQLASPVNAFIYPADRTASYAALHGDRLWGGAGMGQAAINSFNAPMAGPIYNMRAFFLNGKYVLYWSDCV